MMPSQAEVPWFDALTLAERARFHGEVVSARSAAQSERGLLARELLRQWRGQRPFDKPGWFQKRLAADGLTETDFSRIVSERVDPPAAGAGLSQPWLTGLAGLLDSPPGNVPSDAGPARGADDYASFLNPLIAAGLERLWQALEGQGARRQEPELSRSATARLFVPLIRDKITAMVMRAVVLDLNIARVEQRLRGETPRDRYESFMAELATPRGHRLFLSRYPVLARKIMEALERWQTNSIEIVIRLQADWVTLLREFTGGIHPGPPVGIAETGDPHSGGKCVSIITFENGTRIIYKPHSMAVDTHFAALLRWLNAHGQEPAFKPCRCLCSGTYGWAEYVEAAPCHSPEEVHGFYRRQGGYLAVLHALGGVDFHGDNVIAAGEHPILVDLETLFHYYPDGMEEGLTAGAQMAIRDSVLRTGLLPQISNDGDDMPMADVSGLGGPCDNGANYPAYGWEDSHTDNMHLVKKKGRFPGGKNRPALNGTYAVVNDYVDDVINGFRNTGELLIRERQRFLAGDGPLQAFAQDTIRVVMRSTRLYSRFIKDLFHPLLLRNALDRDRHLDLLWCAAEDNPRLEALIPFERRDLERADIPFFCARPGSSDLWTSAGEKLAGYFGHTALSTAAERLKGLDTTVLDEQTWYIRASLASRENVTVSAEPAATPGSALPGRRIDNLKGEVTGSARAIADWLMRRARAGPGDTVSWTGLTLLPDGTWRVEPLGPDLYSGMAGVVLFLAWFGHIAQDQEATTLARRAYRSLSQQWSAMLGGRPELRTIGAFEGMGGWMYLCGHLAYLWEDDSYLSTARSLIPVIEETCAGDRAHDIIAGAAGAIGSLLSLYALAPAPETLCAATACGDSLIASAKPMARGMAWEPCLKASQPLTGFSHGAAGIAWALMRLYHHTREERFRHAARQALEYERSWFDEQRSNWPDFREFEGVPAASKMSYAADWCHGAPGIALSRIPFLCGDDAEGARADMEHALKTTVAQGFQRSHCLCHGALGNFACLWEASKKLRRAEWRDLARTMKMKLQSHLNGATILCGTPGSLEVPGLMTGVAGAGMGILQLAFPDRVPCVLSLSSPIGNGEEFGKRPTNHSELSLTAEGHTTR